MFKFYHSYIETLDIDSCLLLFLFFAKFVKQNLFIRILIISDKMSIMWIKLNLLDLWNVLVVIFIKVELKNSSSNIFSKELRQAMIKINP